MNENTENAKRVSSSEAVAEIINALAAGRQPPKMMLTSVDRVEHVYVLAALEAVFNCQNYFDGKGENTVYDRTDAEKKFCVFSGKAGEIECLRQLMRKGYIVEKGTVLFSPRHDDGVDHEYEKLGAVQIKYRHGREFTIKAGVLSKCRDEGITLLVVRCDEFYDDYRPREGSMDWRSPPSNDAGPPDVSPSAYSST